MIGFLIALVPLVVSAQDFSGMDSQQMQAMMQNAQKMQTCMQNIDQSAMADLQKKGQKMAAEVKALCAAGKRSEATAKAMAYGQQMASDPSLKDMRKCSEMMGDVMPELMEIAAPYMDENSDQHICDE